MESGMILGDGLDLSGEGRGMSGTVRVTEAGGQELKHAQKGLSVWQRRLLLALQTHESLDLALNSDPVLRRPQLSSDFSRLLELGLVTRHRSANLTPGAGDAVGRIVANARPRGPVPGSLFGRLPLIPIAVGAIFVAVVFAYLFARPGTKGVKPPAALAATSAPPSPAVARKPAASEAPEPAGKGVAIPPPASVPAAAPPSPAVVSRGETPKKPVADVKEAKASVAARSGERNATNVTNAVNATSVAKSRNSAPSIPATEEVNSQSDTSSPPREEAKPDVPPEKAHAADAAAGGAALAARTEPSLRKSRACPTPEYPPDSLTLREEGTVELRFLIDEDGNVAEAKIATSSGSSRLDNAARDVLSRCRFVPGTVNGKPEPAWARLRYTWRLD
jgi:TonB family protein